MTAWILNAKAIEISTMRFLPVCELVRDIQMGAMSGRLRNRGRFLAEKFQFDFPPPGFEILRDG